MYALSRDGVSCLLVDEEKALARIESGKVSMPNRLLNIEAAITNNPTLISKIRFDVNI
jgi:hypothetical protein